MPDELKTPAEAVKAFRERHRLDQAGLDRLLGFASGGRATRRWEASGAPYYVTLLMEYGDRFGVGLMEELAARRDAKASKRKA